MVQNSKGTKGNGENTSLHPIPVPSSFPSSEQPVLPVSSRDIYVYSSKYTHIVFFSHFYTKGSLLCVHDYTIYLFPLNNIS